MESSPTSRAEIFFPRRMKHFWEFAESLTEPSLHPLPKALLAAMIILLICRPGDTFGRTTFLAALIPVSLLVSFPGRVWRDVLDTLSNSDASRKPGQRAGWLLNRRFFLPGASKAPGADAVPVILHSRPSAKLPPGARMESAAILFCGGKGFIGLMKGFFLPRSLTSSK
jgi:hypothetical protein